MPAVPLGTQGSGSQHWEGMKSGQKKWAEDSPPYLIGLKDQVWRVSRVGSVPRKQGGGGDQWMRSTSRNVRAMRRQERSLDLAQGRELHPAEGQRVGGCKKGIYPTVFQLTPPTPQDTNTGTSSPTQTSHGLSGVKRRPKRRGREQREPHTKRRPFSPPKAFQK